MVLNNKKCAGFTILEVVITIGILSIVLLSATKLLASYIKTSQDIGVSGDYTENLRIASNQIMDQVKKANTAKSVRVENGDQQLFINDQLILDAEKKASNTNNAQLWLYDRGADGAELRIKDGTNSRVLAAYIERITIDPLPAEKYLNVIIEVKDTKAATISIPKTYAFASVLDESPDEPEEHPNTLWGKFLTYSNELVVENANVSGDAIVYVADNRYDFKIKNSQTKIWTSSIYINQDIAELDNATLGADRNSSVYVNGNITVKNPPPKINGSLYYTGTIKTDQGQNIERTISNAYKRDSDSINFLDIHMPQPFDDPSKYRDFKPYNFSTRLMSREKYKGESIQIRGYSVEDVIIYCTGNNTISIENNNTFVSGILYAPNGTVKIDGADFEGTIIANKIVIWNDNTYVKFRHYNIEEFPFLYQK